MKNTKRYPVHMWNKVPIEQVKNIPEDIDGLRVYEITQSGKAVKGMPRLRDGRRWKKSSQTRWSGYNNVRYSDCSGSYRCINSACNFKREYGVVNRTHFDKMTKTCSICGSAGQYIQCNARRYIASCGKTTRVYHYGKHTCPSVSVEGKQGSKEVSRQLQENPSLTPSQIQSNLIISQMKQGMNYYT